MNFILCLYFVIFPLQSDRQFKVFYAEGKALYEQNSYQAAADRFQEALRLDGKPQRIKIEGTFFEPYQPRYWLALCHEQLDVEQAAVWVEQARQAGEGEVDKNRKLVAQFNTDCERILRSAESVRSARVAKVRVQLDKADQYLAQDRFDDAKTIYHDVFTADPENSDAYAGIQKVALARNAFVERKELETRLALGEERFDDAKQLISEIAALEPKHTSLPLLNQQLKDAQQKEAVVSSTKDKPQVTQPQTTRSNPIVTKVDTTPIPTVTKKSGSDTIDRQALRQALLAAVKPFKQGNPTAALKMLESIDVKGHEEVGSYHWLKGLFLLTTYYQYHDQSPELIARGEQEISRAFELSPGFSPDPEIYPGYILKHVDAIRAAEAQL